MLTAGEICAKVWARLAQKKKKHKIMFGDEIRRPIEIRSSKLANGHVPTSTLT